MNEQRGTYTGIQQTTTSVQCRNLLCVVQAFYCQALRPTAGQMCIPISTQGLEPPAVHILANCNRIFQCSCLSSVWPKKCLLKYSLHLSAGTLYYLKGADYVVLLLREDTKDNPYSSAKLDTDRCRTLHLTDTNS